MERTVDGAIDFDTGQTGELPASSGSVPRDLVQNVLQALAWMEKNGMDAVTEPSRSLQGSGLKLAILPKDAWDQLSPEQLDRTLDPIRSQKWQTIDSGEQDTPSPQTYAFQTREGGRGLLQILAFAGQGVKLRYKLVQASAGTKASNVESQPSAKSPKDVSSRLITAVGSLARTGPDSTWQIDARVAEADIAPVEKGQLVTVTVDAFPRRTFHGKVVERRETPITVGNSVTYAVEIDVDDPDPRFLLGMTATIEIHIDPPPQRAAP
jgi:hypothetical protein